MPRRDKGMDVWALGNSLSQCARTNNAVPTVPEDVTEEDAKNYTGRWCLLTVKDPPKDAPAFTTR